MATANQFIETRKRRASHASRSGTLERWSRTCYASTASSSRTFRVILGVPSSRTSSTRRGQSLRPRQDVGQRLRCRRPCRSQWVDGRAGHVRGPLRPRCRAQHGTRPLQADKLVGRGLGDRHSRRVRRSRRDRRHLREGRRARNDSRKPGEASFGATPRGLIGIQQCRHVVCRSVDWKWLPALSARVKGLSRLVSAMLGVVVLRLVLLIPDRAVVAVSPARRSSAAGSPPAARTRRASWPREPKTSRKSGRKCVGSRRQWRSQTWRVDQ